MHHFSLDIDTASTLKRIMVIGSMHTILIKHTKLSKELSTIIKRAVDSDNEEDSARNKRSRE